MSYLSIYFFFSLHTGPVKAHQITGNSEILLLSKRLQLCAQFRSHLQGLKLSYTEYFVKDYSFVLNFIFKFH